MKDIIRDLLGIYIF